MGIKKNIFAPLALGLGATRRAAVLLLVMLLTTATAWAQTTITPTTPSQDGDGYFLIGTAAELYGFAELVNNGNATANAKLTADIVVNENVLDANGEANTGDFVQWTPIGNNYFEDKVYSGTFDGQGHTVSGLYVSGSSWRVGLIGAVSGSAVVKNLGIVDSYFSSSNNLLGSIVGEVSYNSSVTLANVYSTSTVKGDNWIGGLAGGGDGSVSVVNSYFAGKTSANFLSGQYGTHHDDLVAGDFNRSTLTVCNAFVLGTSQYGTSVTAGQLSDGTVAAALHYYQDALADGSMFGLSGGKTNFSGTIDGVSVTTANITLHTFDGDATAYSSKYIVGNTTPLPVNVEREGYTFFGWYDNADLEGDAVTSISSSETGNKEYWAKFERSHSVTFVLNDGSIFKGEIDHYIEGETTVLPTMVFKNSASFEGWYTTEDFTGDRYYSIPATATEDMTFYAKWGAEKTTFDLRQGPETVNILYEGENLVWLDKTTIHWYMIYHNEYRYWGSGDYINVPYDGGEYAFSNNSRNYFIVNQSGFYVFTLTDKGDGNWFVSVLKSMLNCDVASIPTQVYTGSAIEPAVTVKDGETTLTLGTDYTIGYSANVNVGTATATITGKGNYSGSREATFTIVYPTVTTSYVDATGTLHENVVAIPLINAMTTLAAGTYVVNSDVAYTGTVTLSGDVTLILGDGCTMSFGKEGELLNATIIECNNHNLTIYGQSGGTGWLKAYSATSSSINHVNNYTQYSGNVLIRHINAYCIDANNSVALLGGTLDVESGGILQGDISGGSISILGGKLWARHNGLWGPQGITLGYTNATDQIYVTIYQAGGMGLQIADGKTLVNDYGEIWSGALYNNQIELGINDRTLRPFKTITLADNADNSSTISEWNGGVANVTLSGRTLYKDGEWNTLCLPFDVTIAGSPLAGDHVVAKVLNTSSELAGGELTLNFDDAPATITAGTPFIIKWDNTGVNLINPVFEGVTTSNTINDVAFTGGTFKGNYGPLEITDANRNDILLLAAGNKLGYAKTDRTIANGKALGSCRAYFEIPSNGGGQAQARSFVLNFGNDNTTGIIEVNTILTDITNKAEGIYDLQGRKVENPKKGLYIVNGRKVQVK